MAALSADAIRDYRVTNATRRLPEIAIKTSTTLYVGSIAAFTTIGRLTPAANATGLRMAGMVVAINNGSPSPITAGTGNAGGTIKAVVETGSEYLLSVLTAARTYSNLDKNVFAATDNEVTDLTAAGTAAVRVRVGKLVQFGATTATGWVAIGVYGEGDAGVAQS